MLVAYRPAHSLSWRSSWLKTLFHGHPTKYALTLKGRYGERMIASDIGLSVVFATVFGVFGFPFRLTTPSCLFLLILLLLHLRVSSSSYDPT
jgi:hypothetical protein